jgi:hypothetical protein
MVNLSMNRLQAGKKASPTLANLVETLIELAVRRDKKYVGAARKQTNHFVGIEQPMPFEQLVVQFLICGKNVGRQSVRLRVRRNGNGA